MQALERSEATNGDRDLARHARRDSRVEKDPPAGHRPDIDQCGLLIGSPAPTEPQVTNVTSASTARIAVGDDEGVTAGMLLEPMPRPIVEYDGELVHHEIMALPASLGRRDVLVVAEDGLLRLRGASRRSGSTLTNPPIQSTRPMVGVVVPTVVEHRSGGRPEVTATAGAPLSLQKRCLVWMDLGPPPASRCEAVKGGNRSR